MGGGSSNGSSPIGLLIFGPILKSGSRFFELFSLEWEGNGYLCIQFDTGIRNSSLSSSVRTGKGNETFSNSSFSFLVDSPSVWALGIRKW
ncbi:hypothetical protein C1645_813540 [Glomus cerebriforme]|uniref:Uncharacterized protein n=1 Tax=Glomus cerebriforme TaxID=658196 RepID=A0A397TMW8_9GLOM|nr:hypothetical protein C1645_813540 [Glomus cerebriforme]